MGKCPSFPFSYENDPFLGQMEACMKKFQLHGAYISHPFNLTEWYGAGKFNPDDGIGIWQNKVHLECSRCIVDLKDVPLDEQDEAVSVTYGCTANFHYCIFRNTGKLILLGSGDEKARKDEEGSLVTFNNCIFEEFGRRGPEVQAGMVCLLNNCIIYNWCSPKYFTVRGFAGWAHDGGKIIAKDCIFLNSNQMTLKQRIQDKVYHISQAWLDDGMKSMFNWRTYVPGWQRGLIGDIDAEHCYASDGVVIEHNHKPMSEGSMRIGIDILERKIHHELIGVEPGTKGEFYEVC